MSTWPHARSGISPCAPRRSSTARRATGELVIGVVVHDGKLTVVDDLEVRQPGPDEVGIRVLASGLCRSDLLPLECPEPEPKVLGHEAAGVVEEVGENVTGITPGQVVAVSCQRPCRRCEACARGRYSACPVAFGIGQTPFTWRGKPARSHARVSSLATNITVDAMQVHPVTALEPASAALIGCAVSTGYGMVRNVAKLAVGESVAVIGVGGIGINSIQTARLFGARRVVAVDINPSKAEVAYAFGADMFVTVEPGLSSEELAALMSAQIGAPVDAVIECTGHLSAIAAAPAILGAGGRLALVGIPGEAPMVGFDVVAMMHKHITVAGALNGACNPFVDLPSIVQLAEQGRLDLAGQVSHRWPLAQVEDAIEALRDGNVLRAVIDLPTDVSSNPKPSPMRPSSSLTTTSPLSAADTEDEAEVDRLHPTR